MASLQEIAGSLNIDIPERRQPTAPKKNLGQKRRSWLAENEQPATTPAEKPVAPAATPEPRPAVENKPTPKPASQPEPSKQTEPGWEPFVWPTAKV